MHRIILDVDLAMGAPGSDIDDGFALAWALADPDLQVDLVTTVNGNTDAGSATALTLELLHRLGCDDLPVHRGAERPLLQSKHRQGTIPDDVVVRDPRPEPAAAAMVEHVLAHPGQITLVAVGPLTNVALALRMHRDFASSLKSLVVMGGRFEPPESVGHGEFNIWNDPEAAQIVLDSPVTARWVGLDVTTQVRMSRDEAVELSGDSRPFAAFAGAHTVAWIDHIHAGPTDGSSSCAMHDPLAVAAVSHPELLTWRPAHLTVDLTEPGLGTTTATFDATDANAEVAVAVDTVGFHRLLLERLRSL